MTVTFGRVVENKRFDCARYRHLRAGDRFRSVKMHGIRAKVLGRTGKLQDHKSIGTPAGRKRTCAPRPDINVRIKIKRV